MTHRILIRFVLAALLLPGLNALHAASTTWVGGTESGGATNWSTAANWTTSGGSTPPGTTDDVLFNDTAITGVSNINNTVDGSTTIGSLQFANTNNAHTTHLSNGVTLTITGANAAGSVLSMFTPGDVGAVSKLLTNVITGIGGTLNVSNPAAVIAVNQGGGASPQRATVRMDGLDNFSATVARIGLGSSVFPQNGNGGTRYGGQLILARTNVIKLGYSDTLANYQLSGRTNAIELARAPGNNPGIISVLFLGQTNEIYADSVSCGLDKSGNNSTAASGVIAFNPAFASPVAYFRGKDGGATDRIKWWSIGDGNASSSSSNGGRGTNDFSLGTVDILADVMSLARECNAANTAWAGPHSGVLRFSAGTVDVNTVYLGNQAFTQPTSTPGCVGTIEVLGATATLIVNDSMVLGRTTGTSATAVKTSGNLRVVDGTVRVHTITKGSSSTNNTISLTNATLVVSNACGTPALPITTYSSTNTTLQLFIAASPVTNVCVTNISIGGTTNVIELGAVAIQSSYPKQIRLISYAGTMSGAYNYGLKAETLPSAAPGAYLSNNVTEKSIDLVLPYDPRPVIATQPSSFSGPTNSTVVFTVAIDPNSVTPLSYQWYRNGVAAADGNTGNGSTNYGAATTSLTISNAQAADSASSPGFTCVITNLHGAVTSSVAVLTVSAGDIAPTITGVTNQTVIQGNNTTISGNVAGNPAPVLQWQLSTNGGVNFDDLAGETGNSLALSNVQYSQNGYQYSLGATNVAGATNAPMTLTVIVTPAISVQPTNQSVTESGSVTFSVVASGVPAVAYQWRKNGTPITHATNASHNIASAAAADTATYSVIITNTAGSVTSSNATLTVLSTMTATALSPTNGATGVCYDTPLYITFSETPVLGTAGSIKIFNSTNPATPVETINLASGVPQPRSSFPGDAQAFNYYPVVISGSTAAIYPHSSTVLTSNQTYYVTIDAGVFVDAGGHYFTGISDSNTWSFATKPTGAADPANPVVNAAGSADFATVQGAVDSLPAANTSRRIITIKNGTYFEIINIAGKSNVTFRGESRAGAIIKYPNNASLAPGGTTQARMTFKLNAIGVALENLTITNSTPQGGSQAEALMISTGAKSNIVNNCDIYSRQDTILANQNSSQVYFYNCKIVGNFDYIWGGGNLFFTNCTIRTISGTGNGIVTAARTDTSGTQSANTPWVNPNGTTYSANGFSFVHCQFLADSGVSNITLAGANGTAGGLVSWALCKFESGAYTNPAAALLNSYVFWQYENTNLSGFNPVSFTQVQTLTNADPRLLAATNVTTWFYGWTPQLLPNILSQPVSTNVNAGQPAAFSVSATGIPDPVYQWQKDGTNVPGATSTTLNIAAAIVADAGSYSVIASNDAGAVTSSIVALTVICPSITVGPATLPDGVTVSGYNQTNTATGGTSPYTFTVDSGSLPDGLNLAATGEITGTPTNIGSFSFCVRATDANGCSDTNCYTVNITAGTPPNILTLNTNVDGVVSALGGYLKAASAGVKGTPTNGALLLIGWNKFTITATASNGYIFSNWVVAGASPYVTNTAKLVFTMESNLVLTANFVTNKFFGAVGTYYGLFSHSNGVTLTNAGFFTGKVKAYAGKPGKLAGGKLLLDGNKVPVKTMTFGLDGSATSLPLLRAAPKYFDQTPLVLRVTLPLDGSGTLSGTVSNEHWMSEVTANVTVASNVYAGSYTLSLPGDSGLGEGYGLVTIDTNAFVKLAGGKLADNTTFSQAKVGLGPNGEWPLYSAGDKTTVDPKEFRSTIMGWVTVSNLPTPGISGHLVWLKKAGGAVYPAGINHELDLEASPYADPGVAPVVPIIPLNGGEGLVILSGGGLGTTLSNAVSLQIVSSKNKFVITNKVNKLSLGLTPKTGKLSGAFTEPVTLLKGKIGGAVLTNQNLGKGHILLSNPTVTNSGSFLLQPN